MEHIANRIGNKLWYNGQKQLRNINEWNGGEIRVESTIATVAMACRDGAKLAVNKKYNKMVFEIDLKSIVGY